MGLGRLHTKLDRFALGANATIVQSRVRLTAEQQSTTTGNRPLFGQSPYVTNLSLRFDDPDAGVTGAIVYNTFGERIVGVGVRATTKFVTPNIKEQPFHKLDLVIGYKPTKHVNLKLKAENLLFQSRRFKQGGTLVFKENYGAKISIGAEYQY